MITALAFCAVQVGSAWAARQIISAHATSAWDVSWHILRGRFRDNPTARKWERITTLVPEDILWTYGEVTHLTEELQLQELLLTWF